MAENREGRRKKSHREFATKNKKKTRIEKQNKKEIKKAKRIKFKDKHPKVALAIKIILIVFLISIAAPFPHKALWAWYPPIG